MTLNNIVDVVISKEAIISYAGIFILAIIGWLTGLFKLLYRLLLTRIKNLKNQEDVPKQTIRVVVDPYSARWNRGTSKGKPVIFLHVDLNITNICREWDIQILDAYLSKQKVHTRIVSIRHPNGNIYGRYPILRGRSSLASVSFTLDQIKVKDNKILYEDVVLLDQFGNEYVLKKIKFNPH